MKRFLTFLMVAALGTSVLMSSAQAKRLGGGGSIGKSSPTYSRQATPPANQAAPAQRPAQPAAPAPASPWRGILGGALLGLGIGALLSHFGLGGAAAGMIGTILMIGLLAAAAFFIYRMISRKSQPASLQPAYGGPMQREQLSEPARTPEIGSGLGGTQSSTWQSSQPALPEGFDANGFLRHAKTNFIRMQAAWDRADVNDIREFTTPEMFGELKMQLTERGATSNTTDVVSIEAEMLGVESNTVEHIASVRFHGMIREDVDAPVEHFSEVWILTKPVAGSGGWLLAGIQQSS
jgi:predicted lipid-binding transport protein (Tim44 family)